MISLTPRADLRSLPGADTPWRTCLSTHLDLPERSEGWQIVYTGSHSRVYRSVTQQPCVAKLAMPRSTPRDTLRKYYNCQARREFDGSRLLRALGLHTPHLLGWGMTPAPRARFESVLLMRPLPESISGLMFVRWESNQRRRHDFLHRFAEQMANLYGHGYIHKDCHFNNVYLTGDHLLIWIDNDIRQPSSLAGCKRGLRKALRVLESAARNDVAPHEWDYFRHRLRAHLARWSVGEKLVHEVR